MAPPPAPGSGGPGDNNAKIMSIASLVVGVIGLCSCMCFVGSIAAIVLGVLGRKGAERTGDASSRTMALIGLGLGVAGIVVGIGWWIWMLVSASSGYSTY
ncbi:DUF4190 domain-containing protein [Janibacter cremeus]|uniref:DUF4190 domain-containing protein n=1 Tax=Janibacter cremeus TaxID=1285192 RepID=UPI0023F8AA5B|nr:DUF4190 domain-containing protein [Janibacter cremeus]WEV78567.1 DUF4190 domain-containing protein [Janibacter cremeus]